ncbi:hypothetical protein N7457_006259 [Penicillium paradoxum]|uniref:uncharacterized protein n=1 Tax=Penicillium paradoxum TaxID=176176 RepID=UPI0025474369|nr:uncharacterized protein N7457_006259 [Penicillium paradoxum]KAJ5781099.1 hypothetical protein N7457_006259 [Penicillium paradoxum]
MELTFLVSRDGANVKRVQTRRACNSCRHKKVSSSVRKRCYHNASQGHSGIEAASSDVLGLSDSHSPASQASRRDPAVRCRSASPRSERLSRSPVHMPPGNEAEFLGITDSGTVADVEQESRRFACDSNPMATLMEQKESRLQKGQSRKGDVGAWLCTEENTIGQGETTSALSRETPGIHVREDRLPPKWCQEALMGIYFRRIHPILPLLDEDKVRAQYREGSLSQRLVQTLCLVASKDSSAAPFLCLGSDSGRLPLERFSNILYDDVMQSISRRAGKKILTIQILALLSLHEWRSTGTEDCSLNLAQAIHHAHTIGLHLMRVDQHSHPPSNGLFWCLWSLDRWNAAMNGRPLMIHDGDMGQRVDEVVSTFQSPFRIWLRIADRLGEAIKYYRPIMKDVDQHELDLPSFQELVEHSEAWDMAPELLETLDLVYHSVIILSTYSSGLQGRSRTRLSNIRQSHSILSIASVSCNQDIRTLLPVPMIGYTIALAFSVTYKQLRESKLPSARRTAISQIRLFHQCLKKIGDTWWSAAVMTRLGQRVLNNLQPTIDQTCSTDPAIDITRPNSRPELSHISPHSLTSTDQLQLSSGVDSAQVGRQVDVEYQSAHLPYGRLGSDNPSDLNGASTPFLTATEIEDFDTFFGNFLDVGLPSCANDQLLLDLDLPDFGFGQTSLA